MRKIITLLIALVLLLSMSINAFAADQSNPTENKTAETDTETAKMSRDDIIKMSNYMNWGNYCCTDDWLVYESYTDSKLSIRSVNQVSKEGISFGQRARYIIPDGLWVIYLSSDGYNGNTCIKRTKVSGADDQVLIADKDLPDTPTGAFSFLIEYDNHLYFAFNNETRSGITGAFYRADRDGSHIKKILDKAVYYPYFLAGKLYYQDDADDCKIHVCDPDGSNDQVFIDDLCFEYVSDGEYFYYTSLINTAVWDENHFISNEDMRKRALKRYSPETGIEILEGASPYVMAYDGNKIYYSDINDSNRLYSYDPKTGNIKIMYLQKDILIKTFTSPGVLRCMVTDSNGTIQKYVNAKLDGTSMS